MKRTAFLTLALLLMLLLFMPLVTAFAYSPANRDEEIDLDWLREEVEHNLERNKVVEVRGWKGDSQISIYHAPSLPPSKDYPEGMPQWLHWLWNIWWYLGAPWRECYPHQFFWDSCAHAMVLSHLDPELAEEEIESLLYAQGEDGFIPHMNWNGERMHWVDRFLQWLYPSNYTSPYLQPPSLAEAVEHIYQESGDIDFLKRVLPNLKSYYLYLEGVRDSDGDGLVEIISSWESKDGSPEYEIVYGESTAKPAWRGPIVRLVLKHWLMHWDIDRTLASDDFVVEDLLFNCIYAQNLFSLSRLCAIVGEEEEAELFQERAELVEGSVLEKMYDEETGLFYSLDARHGEERQLKVSTVSSLMPLILDGISQSQVERLVQEHLLNPEEFWTEYPIPAEPASSQEEGDQYLWRGLQTWVYPNWYIAAGLRKQALRFPEHREEYNQIADEITIKTYQLVRKEGFRESYHSQTGKGGGACNYGWSTLVLIMVGDMERW